jgi:fluoroacetyl-CoA thioesterase
MSTTETLPILAVGLHHREKLTVAPSHTVPQVNRGWLGFEDMPPVFATAMMIGFTEQTCILALRPYLSAGQRTVGIHVSMSHVAPTPVGMAVTSDVELIGIDGRFLDFKVRCCDESELIGEGTHRRAIIDLDRFTCRLEVKAGGLA